MFIHQKFTKKTSVIQTKTHSPHLYTNQSSKTQEKSAPLQAHLTHCKNEQHKQNLDK